MVLLMKTKKIMAFLKTNVKSPRESPAGPRSQVWPKKPSCLDRHVSTGGAPTRQPPSHHLHARIHEPPISRRTRSTLKPPPRVDARRSTHATRPTKEAHAPGTSARCPPRAWQLKKRSHRCQFSVPFFPLSARF